ncbi:DUF4124 domain-containing protein [Aliikangiella sp. IMCC44653]
MKNALLLISIIFYALVGSSSVSAAEEQFIYKWKDKDGMVHYTERRPEPGIQFEKVRKRVDKGSLPTKSSTSSIDGEKSEAEAQAEDSYSKWRQQNCKVATQNLDVLQNADRISKDDGEGGKRLMTEEEKQANIQKMTEQKAKYCGPAKES